MEFTINKDYLVRDETAPVSNKVPPEFFTTDFLAAMFNTPADLEGSPHKLCSRLDPAGRILLKKFCQSHDLLAAYLKAANSWAAVGCLDGVWRREHLAIIYKVRADTYLAEDIMVDVQNRRFITTVDPEYAHVLILSWAEFQHRYGQTVPAHLYQYIGIETRRLEGVLSDLDSTIICRDRDLINLESGRRQTMQCFGLSKVAVENWEVPLGWKLAP
jgi:hypothetical protein